MRVPFLTLSLALTMTQLSVASDIWKKLPSLPVPSGNFLAATMGKDVVLAGGITWKNDTKNFSDQIWRFDSAKQSWAQVGTLPHPMAYPAAGESERGIFFCGGSDGKTTSREFYLLNKSLKLEKLGEISQPRVYSGAAISGGKLFVVAGGTDVVDLKTLTNSFYSVDLASGKTETLPEFPGGNYIVPAVTAIGDRIFAFTGAYLDVDGKPINMDSAFVYNVKASGWKKIKSYPLHVRGLASCALDERYILLAGGYTNEFTDATFVYDTQSDAYFKTAPLPYRAMSNFIKAGDKIYWAGGEDKMRHRSELFYVTTRKQLLEAAGVSPK
jgi:hypothetical protein